MFKEREKKSLEVDGPVGAAADSCYRDESSYIPTVGRWGNEWPSWLEIRPTPDNHNYDDYAFWLNHGQKADWPIGQPVPLPKWGSSRPPLVVSSIEKYEQLTIQFENEVQTLLQAYNYDSVTNFIKWVIWLLITLRNNNTFFNRQFCILFYFRFYNEFKIGKYETLENFFREYEPPLTKDANTCVGLGLLLIGKLALLEDIFPGVKNSLYMVSCEESIEVLKNVLLCISSGHTINTIVT